MSFYTLAVAMEEIIADMIGRRDMMTGATAGGITGGFFATIVGKSVVYIVSAETLDLRQLQVVVFVGYKVQPPGLSLEQRFTMSVKNLKSGA